MVEPDQRSERSLRVVLVDSRDERRQVMRHVVQGTDAGATVVGEADNATEATALVENKHADAVVLDIQMPLRKGLETIAALRGRFADLGIVVCSFHLDPVTKEEAFAQGADAYLAKPLGPADLNAVLKSLRRCGSTSQRPWLPRGNLAGPV